MIWAVGLLLFVFFKQKTAYEMRISDWSSDVCSSDLIGGAASEIDACRRRERDHRPRTDITRASAPASTAASTVSLTPDGSAIPIWPLPTIAAVDPEISPSANDGGAVRFNPSRAPASQSRRHAESSQHPNPVRVSSEGRWVGQRG